MRISIRHRAGRARRQEVTGEDAAQPSPTEGAAAGASGRDVVLDLRGSGWADGAPASGRSAELWAELRARRARRDALKDLQRLRARHWSAARVVEEGRLGLDWWEHPEADPYAVLSLLPGASLEEAAAARRRIAMECHPDRLAPDADQDLALRRMVAANAAFDRLRRAFVRV